ncbi:putative ribonuclease H-like domain-containing protein, partial [Tanacetum coccineum]
RKFALNFMRPFGCPVTILNTIYHLGSGTNNLFDIDALTKSMNYKLVVASNQSNGNTGTKACDNAGKARMETIPGKDYILPPLSIQDPPFSSSLKDSPDAGFKPLGTEEKKDAKDPGNEDSEVPSIEEPRVNQEKDASVNNTNTINTEEIVYSDNDEDVGTEADINNLDTHINVNPIPTTRIHKDHPAEQIIGDIYSTPQTRRMTKSVTEQAMFSSVQQRTNRKDFQNCLFACFLSQEEPKKVIQALKDPSWIEVMQEELLQFKLQQVWTLVDLPNNKRAIGTKWVYKNKKDERGIVIKSKARLVAQGYTQEEGIDYDEVFAPVARIEAIRLFLAYASFKDFMVYQMDAKSYFLYKKIEKEVYVCQPLGFEDLDFPDRVYKVEKALYGLHQAPKAWYETLSTYLLDNGFQRGKIDKTLFIRRDKDDEDVDEHLYRSMIGSLMYLTSSRPDIMFADSPFDLVAYTDSDYAGASLDRKSTKGGCQFLGCRLISWHCKKQIMVANSTTKAEYIAASNCCGQNPVFYSKTKHIEIRHHFIIDSNEKKLIQMIKIYIDQNVADLLTKAFDVSRFEYLIASIGMLNL